jgi:hypothetical protein
MDKNNAFFFASLAPLCEKNKIMLTKANYIKTSARLVCLALAAVFIISSVAKLMYFTDTISYFLEFRVIAKSPFIALIFSSLLVSLEIALGVALIAEKNPAKPLLLSASVMAAFTVFQAVTMIFPAKFTKTCPCFGASADAVGIDWWPLLRNVLLLALSIGCYLYYKRKQMSHHGDMEDTEIGRETRIGTNSPANFKTN